MDQLPHGYDELGRAAALLHSQADRADRLCVQLHSGQHSAHGGLLLQVLPVSSWPRMRVRQPLEEKIAYHCRANLERLMRVYKEDLFYNKSRFKT